MTRLHRCRIENCNELIPLDQEVCGIPICPCCGSTHTRWVRGIVGKAKMCDGCLAGKDKEKRKLYRQIYRVCPPDDPVYQPAKPKPRPKLTERQRQRLDAEQRKLDRAVNDRLYKGCANGPVRRLTREEIAKVAHTITPPERITSQADRAIYLWGTM